MTVTRRSAVVVVALVVVALLSGFALSATSAGAGTLSTAKDKDYDAQIAAANKKAKAFEKELDNLDDELDELGDEIISTNRKILALEAELPGLRKELAQAKERLNAALVQQKIVEEKLTAARAQDEAITQEIADDEVRIEELKVTLGALARDKYMGEGTNESLSLVFGAQTSREFVDRFAAQHSASRVQATALDEIEQIAATNRNRGARQVAVREYIEELKVEADALVKEAAAARKAAQAKKDEVDKALAEMSSLKARLAEQRAAAIAKQAAVEKQQEKVRDQILVLVRKKMEAQKKKNPTPLGTGYLSFPTKVPYVTSNYGRRYHPVLHYWRLHAGTDFRAYCGTPIYASAEGKVEWAKSVGGFGNQVMIDHGIVKGNSLFTSYNHLSRFNVSAGQYVTRNTIVGYSGSTGTSTACHLHFEVYLNGVTVNPMSILGPVPS